MNKKEEYAQKLLDPRWQRKRLEVMERDHFYCRTCGDEKTTLNVHHISYHGDPWETPIDQLLTLCRHCHSVISHYGLNILYASQSPLQTCTKVKRNSGVLCAFQHPTGLIVCFISDQGLIELANIDDKDLRDFVQIIINNWLFAEKEHLLIDQSPIYV